MHALEPASPLEDRTEMPLAAASASAPSAERMPLVPIASSSSASHVPSDAEITSGTRLPF